MKKRLVYLLFFLIVSFFLFFPFIHIGGPYYRGLILIWNQYSLKGRSGGGFIDLTPDINWYEIVWRADPFTFRHLDGRYAIDRNHIYAGGRLIPMDVKTFRPLGNGFCGDKNNVLMVESLIKKKIDSESEFEAFDSETFQFIGANFVKDKTGIYYLTPQTYFEPKINLNSEFATQVYVFRRVEIADFETFTHVKKCIFKDKNFLYKSNMCGSISDKGISIGGNVSGAGTLEIIQPLEADFFQPLGCYFYITRKGIYWSDKEIRKADVDTFQIFEKEKGNDCKFNFYAKDKNFVYYQNFVVEDADPETFKIIGVNGYQGEDKNFKYDLGRKTK